MSSFYWLPVNQNVRNFNKHAVVDLIRFARRGISRADLAEHMGLTRAALTIIVNELIKNGIILETESRTTSSGRRAFMMGALVQAINFAIHNSIHQKTPYPKSPTSEFNKQRDPIPSEMEVIASED